MSAWLKTLIKVAVSLAFFLVLLSFVRANELLAVFTKVNWMWLTLSFGVTLLMLAIGCAKWKTVLDLKERSLTYGELMKIYAIGVFFSNILPSTFGGDVVRSYYAGKLIDNQSYAAVSVFVERFSGAVFLLFLVAFAPFLQPELLASPYLYLPAMGGLCMGTVILWMFFSELPLTLANTLSRVCLEYVKALSHHRAFTFLSKPLHFCEHLYARLLGRLSRLKAEMRVAATAIRSDVPFIVKMVLLTFLFYLLSWLNVYSAFKAFDVEVSLLAICALVPAIMIVAQIPVTLLGNLGYFESVFVFYFLLVGVGGAETLAMGLLLRVKLLCVGAVGFLVYMLYKRKYHLVPERSENVV
jgi:glycosyltransferase 2 family protein